MCVSRSVIIGVRTDRWRLVTMLGARVGSNASPLDILMHVLAVGTEARLVHFVLAC